MLSGSLYLKDQKNNGEYFLAPAYDLINTCIHIQSGSDLGLMEGLSPDIEKSDAYDRTGHPCRLDFERFAERIGLPKKRAASVLEIGRASCRERVCQYV